MDLNKLFRNVNKYMMYGGNLGKMNKEIEAMKEEEEEKYKDKADIDGGKDCKLYDVEKRFNLYAKETGIILNWLKEDSFEKEEKKEVIEKLSDLITKLEQQRDLAAGNDSQTSRKKCFDSVYDKLNKSYMDIVKAQKEESDVVQPDVEEVNSQPDVEEVNAQPDVEEVNAQPDVEEESCDGNCVLKTFKNVSTIEQYIKNNLKSGKLTDAKDNINKIENELEEISKGNKKDFDVVKEVIAETEKWIKSPEEACDDDCISGLFEDIIEIENRFDPNNSNAQGEIEKINEKLNEISLSEKKFYAKDDSKIIKEEIKKHKKWIKEQESAIGSPSGQPSQSDDSEKPNEEPESSELSSPNSTDNSEKPNEEPESEDSESLSKIPTVLQPGLKPKEEYNRFWDILNEIIRIRKEMEATETDAIRLREDLRSKNDDKNIDILRDISIESANLFNKIHEKYTNIVMDPFMSNGIIHSDATIIKIKKKLGNNYDFAEALNKSINENNELAISAYNNTSVNQQEYNPYYPTQAYNNFTEQSPIYTDSFKSISDTSVQDNTMQKDLESLEDSPVNKMSLAAILTIIFKILVPTCGLIICVCIFLSIFFIIAYNMRTPKKK